MNDGQVFLPQHMDLPPEEPKNIDKEPDYTNMKLTHVEHLSFISYLTKATEDYIIQKIPLMKFPLLLIDIPLFFAVFIVHMERFIYTEIIDRFMSYIRFDVKIITYRFRHLFPKKGGEDEEENEEVEETFSGKFFQKLRFILKLLWGIFVFGLILPIWPFIILYNIFVEILIIGGFYYFLIYYDFSGWGGMLLYFFLFATVSFIISSISVPSFLRIFTYIKYLFSLERKPWRVVNAEARASFLRLYLNIHQNRDILLDKAKSPYDEEPKKAEGGIYYLLLTIIHRIKDKLWKARKAKISAIFDQVGATLHSTEQELEQEKEMYVENLKHMNPKELRKISFALIFTFLLAAGLLNRGIHGHGILGPIILSFLDQSKAAALWTHYEGHAFGYYQYLASFADILPGFIKFVARTADLFFAYFFEFYYQFFPWYMNFIAEYYTFYFGNIVSPIFY